MITASAFRAYVLEHPTATNEELAEALKTGEDLVRSYISKQKTQGRIQVDRDQDGVRTITVDPSWTKDAEVLVNETKLRKQTIYERMLAAYMEDFEAAAGYQERTEIGKLILRLLEKI